MGGNVMEPAALWVRCTFGLSCRTALSDIVEGDSRDGESCCTSSAFPSTDMERRNLEDWCGGGSTGPEAVEGRDAGMNSCLVGVSIIHEIMGQLPFTYKSLGSGEDSGTMCQRVACLQNILRSPIGRAGWAVEAGQL